MMMMISISNTFFKSILYFVFEQSKMYYLQRKKMSRNVLNRDSSTFNEDFREDTTTLYVKADARTNYP